MILTCPSCQSRYVVPDSAIGASGRKVRCAACRHSWFQAPAAQGAAGESPVTQEARSNRAPAEPSPAPAFGADGRGLAEPADYPAPPLQREPMDAEAPPETTDIYAHDFRPRRNRARWWTIAAIVAGLLMTSAAVAIQYFGLPGFGDRLGIPVQSADSLRIVEENAQTRQLERGNDVLEVSGAIINQTDEVQRVPQIRAELKDAQGRVIYSWSIAPPVRDLQPRGRVAFNSANVGVPPGGSMLSLTFAPIS